MMTTQKLNWPEPPTLDPQVLAKFMEASSSSQEHFYTVLLNIKPPKTLELADMVSEGLEFAAWEAFLENTHLSQDLLLWLTHIKKSTLYRRKERGLFDLLESEQLIRVARVFGKILNLYDGNLAAVLRWVEKPHRFLGKRTPLQLMQTEIGANEVESLIGRMAHGVFS